MLEANLTKLPSEEISFNIAGVNFSLSSESRDHIDWLKHNYRPFLNSGTAKQDVQVTVRTKRRPGRGGTLSARTNPSLLKLEYKGRLTAEADLAAGQVSAEAKDGFGLGDFIRSLVSAVLVEKEGFLLHASGVAVDDGGYVFSGPSGSGKTTIARLSGARDVLNDETVAFRRRTGSWHVYATPFFGELGAQDKSIWVPLKAVFFLQRGKGFSHRQLSRREAIMRIFSNIISRDNRPASMGKLLNTAAETAKTIPCYDLYFEPDISIWRYIDAVN